MIWSKCDTYARRKLLYILRWKEMKLYLHVSIKSDMIQLIINICDVTYIVATSARLGHGFFSIKGTFPRFRHRAYEESSQLFSPWLI